MDHLPMSDTGLLVSSINFLLRDHLYEDLEDVCYGFDVTIEDIEAKLSEAGYSYSKEQNRII